MQFNTLQEAAAALAKTATEARLRRDLEKRALITMPQFLQNAAGAVKGLGTMSSIGEGINKATDWVKANPEIGGTLLGAGGGALVGGLSSLSRRPEERDTAGSALTGALAGAGLGLGAGYAIPRLTGGQGLFTSNSPEHKQKLDSINRILKGEADARAKNAPGIGSAFVDAAPVTGSIGAAAGGEYLHNRLGRTDEHIRKGLENTDAVEVGTKKMRIDPHGLGEQTRADTVFAEPQFRDVGRDETLHFVNRAQPGGIMRGRSDLSRMLSESQHAINQEALSAVPGLTHGQLQNAYRRGRAMNIYGDAAKHDLSGHYRSAMSGKGLLTLLAALAAPTASKYLYDQGLTQFQRAD